MRRRDLLIGVLSLVLLLPLLTARLYASDEIQYFSYLRSLWFDRDLSFDNEYRELVSRGVAAGSGFEATNLSLVTATGLRPNFGTIGSAILWAPFYAAGDVVAHVMRAAGSDVGVDGYSTPYIAAVCLGSAVYGMFALVLSAAIARAVTGPAGGAAVAVLFGTPLLFYMFLAPGFAHATSAFGVALFIYVWLRVRGAWTTRGVVALGAAAGLMAIVREQDAFIVIGPALDIVRDLVGAGRRRAGDRAAPGFGGLAAGAIAAAAIMLPQLWTYLVLNGRIGPSPLVSRKMTWYAPHAGGVLFSPEHGFLFWTPLAVVALAGLLMLTARGRDRNRDPDARWIAICALAMIASQVYVAGSVESWTVAGSFGQRRFVALTPLLVLGVAALLTAAVRWTRAGRLAVATLLAVCVWWNLGLMAQFGTRTMDRQRLTLPENAWRTFVELPGRAPAIAKRFFTDRASFYGPAR